MRMHIVMDDELVEKIDRLAGERGRSGWIVKVVRDAVDFEERWAAIEAGLGCLADVPHEWDDDPAEWVRRQRSEEMWRSTPVGDPAG